MDNFEKAVIELTDLIWEEKSTEGHSGLVALLQNIKKEGLDYQLDEFLNFTESTFCAPSRIDILKIDPTDAGLLSEILNLFSLLDGQLENEKVAMSLIYKLSPFLPIHFGHYKELETVCERLWRACSNNRLSITFQDQLADINPEFLRKMVDKTINECTVCVKLDLTYLKINDTYQKLILPLCLRSNATFRVIVRWVANQIMKLPAKLASYQAFFNEFLDALRSEMLNSEFRGMFPSDLINEITILDELNDCEDQTFPMEILEAARLDSYHNFVILAASIPNYNHLLLKK